MLRLLLHPLPALLLLFLLLPFALAQIEQEYDYIVVGSGPGGGPLAANLARAGQSVLLLEAGDDEADNPNMWNMSNFNEASNDPTSRWDFFIRQHSDESVDDRYQHLVWRRADGSLYTGLDPPAGATKLGAWYPRAGTLGGCAMHNGGVFVLPSDDDWDAIAALTGDRSWAAGAMRRYFVGLENNTWLPRGTPGHGFDGWCQDSIRDPSWAAPGAAGRADDKTMARLLARATSGGGSDGGGSGNASDLAALAVRDVNDLSPRHDQEVGLFAFPLHDTPAGNRSGPNAYIRATLADPAGYPLTVQLETLVTRVLFRNGTGGAGDGHAGTRPAAVGVEYLRGKSLYSADPRHNASRRGVAGRAFARKETILAGGAFNTPQLLKLSGVGPAGELRRLGLPVVRDLPGVGERLADNYEAYVLSLARRDLRVSPNAFSLMLKTATAPAPRRRNVNAWCGGFVFEGYWPGYQNYDLGPSEYECAMVHMNPRSQAGTVRLRSADPQDTPDINLRFFETGGDEDLAEMVDAAKTIRAAFAPAPADLQPWREVFPCPGVGGNQSCTDEQIREQLRVQAHSHHVTSSCAIGPDDDPMAVLDSRFRVRGVDNLRVVDASAFPFVPGSFPVLPTMMLGMKGADVILEDA